MVTAMAGASPPSPNKSTPPNHSSSWKGADRGQANHNIRAKSSHVQAPPCESSDLAHRLGGDNGDARFIEDAMPQLHHLHGCPEPTPDLRGQVLPEDRHLFAIRVQICVGRSPCAPSSGAAGQTAASREACLRLATETRCGHSSAGMPGAGHPRGRAIPARRPSSRSPPMDFTGYRKIASTCPISMSILGQL